MHLLSIFPSSLWGMGGQDLFHLDFIDFGFQTKKVSEIQTFWKGDATELSEIQTFWKGDATELSENQTSSDFRHSLF